MLRDRALKLTSQIRALREALGDVPQHGRQGDAANRSLIEVERQLQAGEPRGVIGRTDEKVEEVPSLQPRSNWMVILHQSGDARACTFVSHSPNATL